ncbi:hypothetical protein D3C81_822730 [compost metagenome]
MRLFNQQSKTCDVRSRHTGAADPVVSFSVGGVFVVFAVCRPCRQNAYAWSHNIRFDAERAVDVRAPGSKAGRDIAFGEARIVVGIESEVHGFVLIG